MMMMMMMMMVVVMSILTSTISASCFFRFLTFLLPYITLHDHHYNKTLRSGSTLTGWDGMSKVMAIGF